jgi:hypothetical protein
VFGILYKFSWKFLHSTKKLATHCHKFTHVSMQSSHCTCQIFIKTEFSRHSFEKSSNIRFYKIFQWRLICPRGQRRRNRYDEINSHFSRLCALVRSKSSELEHDKVEKGKLRQSCPCSQHKGEWRSGGIAPLIHNVGTGAG